MARPTSRLRQLGDLARTLSSTAEPDAVLHQLVEGLRGLCPGADCRVQLTPAARGLPGVAGRVPEPLAPELSGRLACRVPIATADEVFGHVEVRCPGTRVLRTEERGAVEILAAHAAAALRHAILLGRSERRRQAAEALAEVGSMTSRAAEGAVAAHICERLRDLLAARAVALHGLDRVSGEAALIATAGPAVASVALLGSAVRGRVPASSPDVLLDPRVTLPPERREQIGREGLRALLAVPLVAHGQVIGVLSVSDRAGRAFDADDMALARAFADQAAVALENARLSARERARREQVDALAEIEQPMISELRSEHLLRLVAEGAARLVKAAAAVYVADGEGLLLRATTDPALFPDASPPAGRDPARLAAQQCRSIVVNDYPAWRLPKGGGVPGLKRALACPLLIGDRVLGVLGAARGGEDPRPFTPEDVTVLEHCARQAAVALQNAMLYEEAERRRREAEELARVARTLGESLDPVAVGRRIVESVLPLFGARTASLRLLESGGVLRAVATAGRDPAHFASTTVLPAGTGVAGRAVADGRPVSVSDVLREPGVALTDALRRRIEASGLAAILAAPLRVKGQTVGALAITDLAGRQFTPAEVGLLQAFADQAALALETAFLYDRLDERAQKLTALTRLTRHITAARSSVSACEAIARAATALLGASTARVWIADTTAGVLRVQASYGIDPHAERLMTDYPVIAFGEGVVGRIVLSRTPVFLNDIADDPRWLNRRLSSEGGLRAFAGLPLVAGDQILGVLAIIFGEAREFSAEEIEVMGFLADHAAIALDNARLWEGQELRATRLRTLASVNQMVSSSLDLTDVLRGIARAAAALTDAPLASISTADPRSGLLERQAFSEPVDDDTAHPERRRGEGVAEWVAAHREPLNVPDVFADGRVQGPAWFRARGLRSTLALPILFQGELLGVLNLFGRQPFVLGPDDQEVLDSFVAQAAVAIRNARLYDELRTAHLELERRQARLVQAERLGALGEMAAGVAHDFNNLLAVILGRSELLARRLAGTDLAGWVDAIRQAARDGADTVRRIQEFTRTRTSRAFERVDVGTVVREVVELTRPRWEDDAQRRGVHYDVRVEGEATAPVAGRPEELREALTNLVVNALEAMPEGGACTLRLRTAGDVVEVAVADTGCGMSEETRQRVFEPFFTTKGQRGNGLGLAMAWGIVRRHGGTIEVDSRPGQGSTFLVRLPVGLEAEVAGPAPAPPPEVRPARILVVDDDPAVRGTLAALLSEEGYTVLEAASGVEALTRCAEERVDVVISDLSMPRMSGWELAATLRDRYPTLPVGLITGWGDRLDPAQIEQHRVRFVIAKPFESKDIVRQIAQVIP